MRYVALFRGSMSAAKRIAMADLRTLLGKLGYADVSDAAHQRVRRLRPAPAATTPPESGSRSHEAEWMRS
jgi:hypothetical protein